MTILISIFTFVLIIISALLVLVVLAQKTKDGGMGAALGGGMTEATFGAETGNVLTKATKHLTIAFFVLSFLLYLGHLHIRKGAAPATSSLPTISAPAVPAPAPQAAPAAATAAPAPAAQPQEPKKP